VGLKLEKELFEGYAVASYSLYALAWLGITPFARELTKRHTYETYYQE
jgi:Na+/proline symporter